MLLAKSRIKWPLKFKNYGTTRIHQLYSDLYLPSCKLLTLCCHWFDLDCNLSSFLVSLLPLASPGLTTFIVWAVSRWVDSHSIFLLIQAYYCACLPGNYLRTRVPLSLLCTRVPCTFRPCRHSLGDFDSWFPGVQGDDVFWQAFAIFESIVRWSRLIWSNVALVLVGKNSSTLEWLAGLELFGKDRLSSLFNTVGFLMLFHQRWRDRLLFSIN